MRRLSLLLALALLLGACSSEESEPGTDRLSSTPAILIDTETPEPDPTTPVAGDLRLSVALPGGSEGEYLLHAPPTVERGRPMPLVLVFHGSPGSPEEMVRLTRFDALADTEDFLVVYPDYLNDVKDISALIDHVAEVWPVDERRIYATGFSRGGTTTYAVAEQLADRIAAFAPVAGVDFGEFAPSRPTSLIAFQGGRDQLTDAFPDVNRAWARGSGCGDAVLSDVDLGGRPATRSVASCADGASHVIYRIERLGHVWPRGATDLIWEFFQAHPLVRS
ncbi:PHB depolymerase family esterase [Nocardioides sp. HM23]|uniref:alpha/beta hydrolase family esterase n=1 Tax=Nocardioides bizhenqiangii TaxID=3095076 RepID=UPI002ACA26A0|nr:PHB depolymerase family esterase [Nocardioides sp. HM23]MDZ5623618.1 PHB depolymerase family esterase [Nocardioides sp. HM23]